MKNKQEIEKEITKLTAEMQQTQGDNEHWDTLNGWLNALRWVVEEEAGENV